MNDKEKNKHEHYEEGNQKIKCGVTDCIHNCIDDCTCRLDSIKVNVVSDQTKACSKDGTCCKSYDYAGDLNEVEVTGRD